MSGSIRIKAVGDISFEGKESDKPSMDHFEDIIEPLSTADIVVGNLESPLLDSGIALQHKCLLRGSPQWALVLKNAGIGIVSLANNHVMDYSKEGLFSTMAALDKVGIRHVGAGNNSHEANSPLIVDIRGKKIAFLGRSSVIVGASIYATQATPGAAFLDVNETISSIKACRDKADYVILLVHWGLEEYLYPAPPQRQLARHFIEAGVNVIIGHHPHVIQGIEYYKTSAILYSLGNFVFNEFEWTHTRPDGQCFPQQLKLTTSNRKGVIASIALRETLAPEVAFLPTNIMTNGNVKIDSEEESLRYLYSLSTWFNMPMYNLRWRLYSINREWNLRKGEPVPIGKILLRLNKVRFHHVRELLVKIRRSAGIVFGKTTNPYK